MFLYLLLITIFHLHSLEPGSEVQVTYGYSWDISEPNTKCLLLLRILIPLRHQHHLQRLLFKPQTTRKIIQGDISHSTTEFSLIFNVLQVPNPNHWSGKACIVPASNSINACPVIAWRGEIIAYQCNLQGASGGTIPLL